MSKLASSLLLLLAASVVRADEHSHRYQDKEQVVPWVNGIGPYANRQETYDYFQLPFCKGDAVVGHRHESLGEALLGVNMEFTGIEIDFKVPVKNKVLCVGELTKDGILDFTYAIDRHYWYKMIIDDLPVYGYIGEFDTSTKPITRFLYTHKTFKFKYNKNQIIDVEVESEKVPLLDETEVPRNSQKDDIVQRIEFSYSVEWTETDELFANRFKNHITFFENKIHWFSIMNSSMIVIFTMGLVVVILMRTLKKDMIRYEGMIGEDGFLDADDVSDEYGWKQIHGDVFRPPIHLTALSGLLGSGLQLGILAFIVILYAVCADVETENGHTISVALFFYAISSILSAFYAGSYYTRNGGKNWARLVFVSSGLWPGTVALMVLAINFVSIYQNSSRAIPFTSMITVVVIWALIVLPLSFLGVVLGKNWYGVNDAVCRINPIPRQIPDCEWYADPVFVVAASGILPFGAIFIEMYYIFTSFWAYRSYYVFGFMMLVFLILVLVTSCVSVVATYFLLNAENHRWNWVMFFSGGSTAFYIFLYSIYYFMARTRMHGLFQTTWYFGYTLLMCFGIFLILGFVGHYSAKKFIRTIYKNIKLD
ncbi:putative endosomal membrane protein EMP70 [Rhizoclosmatium globosum]|uniref:Transmembrane 9 superfamily member n=1 Tax=Rhizoclosmatium globosum TaxID=329046 RepID=A0A1Y2CX16_9FUNG|nr:putative endosomal membrane protein EMP70 [Rhizoclosmatium globosum]|eukprot:ORY51578.1 putative endosomal membrane protein EMP70 [Rhizoclosmatium globosum]